MFSSLQALIKSSIEIYELMGMQTLDAYVQDFETQLLEATRYVQWLGCCCVLMTFQFVCVCVCVCSCACVFYGSI